MSAFGTVPMEAWLVLLPGAGSAVSLAARPVRVTLVAGPEGAVKLTVQVMLAPTAKVVGIGLGKQTAVAPDGKDAAVQVGLVATLGPLLVQTNVPLTGVPPTAVAGKPLTVACMSACGMMTSGAVSTLFVATGSAVLVPAVVTMLSGPAPGAMKVLVQVMIDPTTKGLAGALHVCVAPDGRPLSAHVGAAAMLGPALVHTPETVTETPALTLAGTVVAACMSACGMTVMGVLALLLPGAGSAVLLLLVPTTVTVPLAGAMNLTVQTMLALRARLVTGGGGTQATVAPAGRPVTAQPAAAAALGPLLVQVTVPVTVEPAGALAGKPLTVACRSACSVMVSGLVLTLLPGTGSLVLLPAVVEMLNVPLAGAVKVLLQVRVALSASGLGTGLGKQLCVAPGGKPLRAQVGAVAPLGPKLVQTPLTVTGWPAVAVAGTVVTACRSACGTTPTDCWAWLLAGDGSAVVLPAVPVMVTPPEAGTTKLTVQVMVPPTASGLVGVVQLRLAPAGRPVTAQVGLSAGLGPLLVQTTLPLTVEPAGALAGKPETTACMSACGVMGSGLVLTLFNRSGIGSAVVEPAVVVMLRVPVAGALKVLLQLIDWPTGRLAGMGLGRQLWVAPAGRPLNTQVGAAASLGPALVHTPLTVTG
jgi:hypothetical protein